MAMGPEAFFQVVKGRRSGRRPLGGEKSPLS